VLVIDDILLFPVKSLLFILREIRNAAQQESADEADALRTELRELYMRLETGQITEQQFDDRETKLLDRLEELETKDSDGPS
jgi:ribosomal protein L29